MKLERVVERLREIFPELADANLYEDERVEDHHITIDESTQTSALLSFDCQIIYNIEDKECTGVYLRIPLLNTWECKPEDLFDIENAHFSFCGFDNAKKFISKHDIWPKTVYVTKDNRIAAFNPNSFHEPLDKIDDILKTKQTEKRIYTYTVG